MARMEFVVLGPVVGWVPRPAGQLGATVRLGQVNREPVAVPCRFGVRGALAATVVGREQLAQVRLPEQPVRLQVPVAQPEAAEYQYRRQAVLQD